MAACAKCPNGSTNIAVNTTKRCTANGRRKMRSLFAPTVTARLSPDARAHIHAYTSTPRNAGHGQRVIGWLRSLWTPTNLNANWTLILQLADRPETAWGSGMTKDLQVLTHEPADCNPSAHINFRGFYVAAKIADAPGPVNIPLHNPGQRPESLKTSALHRSGHLA